MTGSLDTGTWRWERSCATWTYELPLRRHIPPAVAIADCARGVLTAIPGFAIPAAAAWTTASTGDDAAVQPRGTPIDETAVAETLRAHPDLIAVALDLDLRVLAPDGDTEVTLEDAAVLRIELEETQLVFWFSLHVDLFARRTLAANPDNEPLARLNAPRLAFFLARLAEATRARFHSVSAPSYAGQATPGGFE